MIKGHLEIELHNHRTGSRERIEQDNLVTNALLQLTNYAVGRNLATSNMLNKVMPVYQKALGGIMIFEDPLVESVNNVQFPHDNFLTAYAGQDLNTSDTECGSINYTESGAVQNGYRTVWDFSTSQANGQISSMALTNSDVYKVDSGSRTPALGNVIFSESIAGDGSQTNNNDSYPIIYGSNYLQAVNTTRGNLRQLRYPTTLYEITDSISQRDVGWTDLSTSVSSVTNKPYINLGNGYIYSFVAFNDVYVAKEEGGETIYELDPGRKEIVIRALHTSTFEIDTNISIKVPILYNGSSHDYDFAIPVGQGIPSMLANDVITMSEDVFYAATTIVYKDGDRKINLIDVYAAKFNTGGSYYHHNYDLTQDEECKLCTIDITEYDDLPPSPTVTESLIYPDHTVLRLYPGTNGCCIIQYRYANVPNTNTQRWRCIVVKPNGEYKIYNKIHNVAISRGELEYLRQSNNIVSFNGNDPKQSIIKANYLGTICNIAQPFEKTNTTSMKVKYTLTNEV